MFKLFRKNNARKVIIPSDYGDTKGVYTFDRENLKGYFPIVMDMIQALKTKYPNIDTSIFEERVKSLTFYDMTFIRKITDKILPQGMLRSNYNVVKNEIKVYDKNSVHELILLIENKRVIMYNYDLQSPQNNKYYISYNDNLLKYAKHLQENYTQ